MSSSLRQLDWLFKAMESWYKSLSKDFILKTSKRTTIHSQCHNKILTKLTLFKNNLC